MYRLKKIPTGQQTCINQNLFITQETVSSTEEEKKNIVGSPEKPSPRSYTMLTSFSFYDNVVRLSIWRNS